MSPQINLNVNPRETILEKHEIGVMSLVAMELNSVISTEAILAKQETGVMSLATMALYDLVSTETVTENYAAGMVSLAAMELYGILLSVVSGMVCLFGTASNIVTIFVFFKQGISDTVTLTLLTLAISDMGSVILMFGVGMCFSPAIVMSTVVNASHLSYMFGWAHVAFARISSGFTVYITLERCLCIALPLKVKRIITMRRTLIILILISLAMMTSVAPVFYTSRMTWTKIAGTNRTIFSLTFSDDRDLVDSISFGVNTGFLVPGILVLMILFTAILAVQLYRKAKWRESVASSGMKPPPTEALAQKRKDKTDGRVSRDEAREDRSENKSTVMSNKDRKVVKMVVSISLIAILCYIPNISTTMTAVVVADYNTGRKEENLLFVTGTLGLFLQAVNSSVTFFVYFKMSSKFKKNFKELMRNVAYSKNKRKQTGKFTRKM